MEECLDLEMLEAASLVKELRGLGDGHHLDHILGPHRPQLGGSLVTGDGSNMLGGKYNSFVVTGM